MNVLEAQELTNAMNIFLDTTVIHARKVVVDDVHDILNVKTTSRNSTSNENWALSSAEGTPSQKSVTLKALRDEGRLTVHPHAHAGCGQNEWK